MASFGVPRINSRWRTPNLTPRICGSLWSGLAPGLFLLPVILFLALGASLAFGQSAAADSDIAGTWRGTLGSGPSQLHLVLIVRKLHGGEYSAQLNSIDQGAELPVDTISVKGKKFHFEVMSVGGFYNGNLDQDWAAVKGTWIQTGAEPQSLSFRRDASVASAPQADAPSGSSTSRASGQATPADNSIAGTWRGALGSGSSQLHLVLIVRKLSGGEYAAQLNSVDQGAELPADSVTLKDNKLHFEVPSIGGSYNGNLNKNLTEADGNWVQKGVPPQPLSFRRDASAGSAAADAPQAVAQTGFSGTWDSQENPVGKQQYTLTIARLSSGEYSGQVEVVGESGSNAFDTVTAQGDAIRLELKQIGGVYEGTLSKDASTITGIWSKEGAPPEPISFKRRPARSADAASVARPGPTTKPITVPLDVVVPLPPTAFKADDKMHLVYELHIVNMSPWNCGLDRIEVVSGDPASHSLANFAGAKLEGMIARPGLEVPEKSQLAPGAEAVVYMWVTVDRPEDVPAALRHRLSVKIGDYPEDSTLETYLLSVGKGAVVISPPLSGDHWQAGNAPSNTSGHRRALIPIDGHAAISQRFAIDWVRLYEDGKSYRGDPLNNKNYYAYGSEALAVADGVVTEVKDGIPENIPGVTSRAVPITLETIGGNHVILDIADGRYAFYAHLQPGSVRVKLGDKVRRGQVVGLVGNTGNSTEPHLHFHISNASSPLGSEGLPYALTSFEVEAKGMGKLDRNGKPAVHSMEIPLENEIVRFPTTP